MFDAVPERHPNVSAQKLRRVSEIPMGGQSASRWYVVHTHPHAENRAAANLTQQKFRVFCPRVFRIVRHARKQTRILAPLFPGYLFVNLDIFRDHWRSVNGTRGVVRLITQEDKPLPIPEGVIEAFEAKMSPEGAMDWSSSLKEGHTVRIADGPFADLIGTLEKLDSSGRVRVLINLLGRAVSVVLRSDTLVPVD
jgi:transcription elongation factor/antiterminator RfaH